MEIIDWHARNTENNENHRIPHENHEPHCNFKISLENHENHENLRIPCDNHENQENIRIPIYFFITAKNNTDIHKFIINS